MVDAKSGDKRPIIIRKKKVVGGGHHGGAWKVAFADFVTALMAFFLVMWLVASANDQQKTAIFDYFKNPSMARGSAPIPAPGQDGPGGASTSPIDMRGGLNASIVSTRKPPRDPRRFFCAAPLPRSLRSNSTGEGFPGYTEPRCRGLPATTPGRAH